MTHSFPSQPAQLTLAELIRNPGGAVYLVGIGGMGMAGLALLLKGLGFHVSGSDLEASRITDWLQKEGVEVCIGVGPDNIEGSMRAVIRSTAIPLDQVELAEAESKDIPVFQRGVVLAAIVNSRTSIAVTGTHGKTTTTAMLIAIFNAHQKPFSYCVGGELNDQCCLAKFSSEGPLIVEADESDGTLVHYAPDIGVITNIEYDHMEHFNDEQAFFNCFKTFGLQVKSHLVMESEGAAVSELEGLTSLTRVGGECEGSYTYEIVEESGAGSVILLKEPVQASVPERLRIPIPGRHNISNGVAAAVAARRSGIPWSAIRAGLESFSSVKRRFEKVVEGAITVVSDYAHHPTEISALIDMAKQIEGQRLLMVFQPHRYTRTLALGQDYPPAFSGVDKLWLTPVYPASEAPIPGGTSHDLSNILDEQNRNHELCDDLDQAWALVKAELREGDLLMIVGAGDVVQLVDRAKSEALIPVERS